MTPLLLIAQGATEYGGLGAGRGGAGGPSRVSDALDWAATATPGDWALIAAGLIVMVLILNRLFDAM